MTNVRATAATNPSRIPGPDACHPQSTVARVPHPQVNRRRPDLQSFVSVIDRCRVFEIALISETEQGRSPHLFPMRATKPIGWLRVPALVLRP